MRNVYEVLRSKELDLQRLRSEVEALRLVAPMLCERDDQLDVAPSLSRSPVPQTNRWPLRVDEVTPSFMKS